MKRRFVTSICMALLVWAAIDDALAAQTPELDDDVAAALDNECLQCAPVEVPARGDALPIYSVAPAALCPAATNGGSVGSSYALCDPLYLCMSMQR